jgi:putative tryptophan/tyrosine transport system substrate-binding protein
LQAQIVTIFLHEQTMNAQRRAFLASLGAALAVPPKSIRAQQSSNLRTLGVLMGLANDAEAQARTKALEHGLASKGWVVGQNLRIEYRYAASDPERMFNFSKELVALDPDIIIGHSTPVVAALRQATQTIPIVFVVVSDPVGSGFVTSIAHPGGNITGFVTLQSTITGKHLSILRELKSQLTRVAFMYNSDSVPEGGTFYIPVFHESAKEFRVTPIEAEVHSTADIEAIMADLGAAPGGGLIVVAGNFTSIHRALIVSLAARWRIPTIYPYRYFVDEGGLVSYGVDVLDLFRRAPDYVDRILQGTRPADLPVQAPKRFELVINLKAARALNLLVPRILLAGADALVE